MNLNYNYIIKLLKSAIHSEPAPEPGHAVDWDNVYETARAHGIAAIIYSTVDKLPAKIKPSSDLLDKWKNSTFLVANKQLTALSSLSSFLKKSSAAGIQLIIFKGLVLAELYTEPLTRSSGDIDLLINENDEALLFKVLNDLGCGDVEIPSDARHEHTYLLGNGVKYEVHKRLWEERIDGAKYKILSDMDLIETDSLIKQRSMGIEFFTLGRYQHFIYMLYHSVKHFIVNGIGIRFLVDLTLYFNAYMNEINGKRFWDDIEKLGYKSFCECIFSLCIKYFNMNPAIYPEYASHSDESEQMLLEDIWEGGMFGKYNATRELSGRILRHYYENDKKKPPKTKIKLIIAMLFPKGSELNRIDFIELSKNKVVAWFQRAKYLLARRNYRIKAGLPNCSMKDRIDCSMKRIKMLERIDLL